MYANEYTKSTTRIHLDQRPNARITQGKSGKNIGRSGAGQPVRAHPVPDHAGVEQTNGGGEGRTRAIGKRARRNETLPCLERKRRRVLYMVDRKPGGGAAARGLVRQTC